MAPIFEKSSIIDVWHGPNPVPATLNKRLPFEYSALSFNDTAIFTVLFNTSLLHIIFFNSASVLLNFFMNQVSNIASRCCLVLVAIIILSYFIFSIFMSMSRLRFIYVISMWSIFHFQPHFHFHSSCNLV